MDKIVLNRNARTVEELFESVSSERREEIIRLIADTQQNNTDKDGGFSGIKFMAELMTSKKIQGVNELLFATFSGAAFVGQTAERAMIMEKTKEALLQALVSKNEKAKRVD